MARDDMREQIRKKIKNEDLYVGCREAFAKRLAARQTLFHVRPAWRTAGGPRWHRGHGGGDHANQQAGDGPLQGGDASVSNFVPKPHTPYQWNGMQTREYLRWAGEYMRRRCRMKSVKVSQHSIETSLLEGILTRGDRRVAVGLEEAWRRGARLDGWRECFNPKLWWQTFEDLGSTSPVLAATAADDEVLPWDHVNVKKGREYLEKEQTRSLVQLQVMAEANECGACNGPNRSPIAGLVRNSTR